MEATKNIRAVWEELQESKPFIIKDILIEANYDALEKALKMFVKCVDAIKEDGINAGWIKKGEGGDENTRNN